MNQKLGFKKKIKFSLYSRYCVQTCNEWQESFPRQAPGQHSCWLKFPNQKKLFKTPGLNHAYYHEYFTKFTVYLLKVFSKYGRNPEVIISDVMRKSVDVNALVFLAEILMYVHGACILHCKKHCNNDNGQTLKSFWKTKSKETAEYGPLRNLLICKQ